MTVSTNSRMTEISQNKTKQKNRYKIVPPAGPKRVASMFQQQHGKNKNKTDCVVVLPMTTTGSLSESPTITFIRLLKLRGRTADLSPMLKPGKSTMQAFMGTTVSLIVRKYRKLRREP